MCEFFSAILQKDEKVLYIDDCNSHDAIVKKYNLKDSDDTKKWLRFEITPIEEKYKKSKEEQFWKLKIDEKTTPDWYLRNKSHYDSLMYNTLWETTGNVIERFDIEEETKLLKLLEKVFKISNTVSEEKAVKEDRPYCIDPAHVVLCIAKTERAKRLISRFIIAKTDYKIPKLKRTIKKEDIKKGNSYSPKSMYSLDYFISIVKLINCVSDHFAITVLNDQPAFIECFDFEFCLAPRIESE